MRYVDRPGAYAVALSAPELHVAVVRTRQGHFLPGGGAEEGEMEEETLAREVLEECGCSVEVVQRIGFAIQYTFAGGGAYYAKQCAFFKVRLGERIAEPTEVDHNLVWVPIDEALELLVEESQRWAVRRACACPGFPVIGPGVRRQEPIGR